ncbi:MAG: hypothetical protein HRU40_15870 [Saprospiraceae bacterium]|nr:hypothetical protein [Saprospiraceae bacterium]
MKEPLMPSLAPSKCICRFSPAKIGIIIPVPAEETSFMVGDPYTLPFS